MSRIIVVRWVLRLRLLRHLWRRLTVRRKRLRSHSSLIGIIAPNVFIGLDEIARHRLVRMGESGCPSRRELITALRRALRARRVYRLIRRALWTSDLRLRRQSRPRHLLELLHRQPMGQFALVLAHLVLTVVASACFIVGAQVLMCAMTPSSGSADARFAVGNRWIGCNLATSLGRSGEEDLTLQVMISRRSMPPLRRSEFFELRLRRRSLPAQLVQIFPIRSTGPKISLRERRR
mmetsp:Transcript_45684/g.95877  ORF Transcript_45684/g.95877 Transcript_45684/m.95877 type:complete len:235 (+) Transcript_45684:822-1526(+)